MNKAFASYAAMQSEIAISTHLRPQSKDAKQAVHWLNEARLGQCKCYP